MSGITTTFVWDDASTPDLLSDGTTSNLYASAGSALDCSLEKQLRDGPDRRQSLTAKSKAADADEILQIKFWLLGVSPMVWRSVLVRVSYTLRELHGVFQVAMGWEAIHLFQFSLRAAFYGSTGMSSPDVTLAALRLRKGSRFLYEYDLNIPWRHEVRIEDRLVPQRKTDHPQCVAGAGHCPPEDCEDPAGFTGRGATS